MKKIIVLLCIFNYSFGNAQDKKWYSNADLELIIHKKVTYSYNYVDADGQKHSVWDEELNTKSPAFRLTYSFNYMLVRKLSIGVLGGYKNYNEPDFSMLELGGIAKFFFVDSNNIYMYGSISSEFSLDKKQFKSGTNARIGLGVPIIKRDGFILSLNLFAEQQFLRLDDAKPIFNSYQENPSDIIYKSYGLSAGVKF